MGASLAPSNDFGVDFTPLSRPLFFPRVSSSHQPDGETHENCLELDAFRQYRDRDCGLSFPFYCEYAAPKIGDNWYTHVSQAKACSNRA